MDRKTYPQQLTFFKDSKRSTCHGGELGRGLRKSRRPVVTNRPMHLVLRAEKARGSLSLLARSHAVSVKRILVTVSHRHRVRVLESANVGNHIHLLVQAQTREGFANFLRRFTCDVALAVTGARKGKAFGRFWTGLAFSRIVEWGRALKTVRHYIARNELEGRGIPKSRGRILLAARGSPGPQDSRGAPRSKWSQGPQRSQGSLYDGAGGNPLRVAAYL